MQDNGGVSWSPIMGKGNFHHGPRFGRVTWVIPGQPLPVAGAPTDAMVAAGTPPGGGPLAADGGKAVAAADGGKGPSTATGTVTAAKVLAPKTDATKAKGK
jgi:hypothetical protein